MAVVIKKSENNYFKTETAIGPAFGATKDTAVTFPSKIEAARAMNHWAFADCEIEEKD